MDKPYYSDCNRQPGYLPACLSGQGGQPGFL